ncbi:MAG: serine/threonine protein kinase [Phycisphaerales bacterium]|nr:serine/threonine protein kinase [Phycisphaerales bacterium]
MEAADWLRLKKLFHEALDLPLVERTAFLRQQCGEDQPLRDRLERLLDATIQAGDAGADHRTAEPTQIPDQSSPLPPNQTGEEAGSRIGPYRLLQNIGEGGFGSVFMAEQEQPIRRRVALKIIKPGMDSRDVVARFEQERQALAVMDHPNIARVFDGGATESGRPYFVMELVRGVPVTEYCDTHQLGIRERLELFTAICEAVQHAHQKGIIHRDLKPSNVLASMQDGRAMVKVIDFGVAKALRDRFTEKTLFTEFHRIIGTPRYMSPEQVDGSLDIDTRSDVYSLGVLLYQLLTGETPFDLRAVGSVADLQRMIREIEPLRPSTRLARAAAEPRDRSQSAAAALPLTKHPASADSSIIAIARQRSTEPTALMRLVRGDLDWIVMKAIERERVRRYESAAALAADVRRFMAHEPVLAMPPSAAYRARKFIARHRVAFAAGSLIAAALVLGIIGTTIGMWRAQRAEARAVQDREKSDRNEKTALAQARRAEQIGDFLQNMLLAIDPDMARGRDVSVLREVLDQTSRRVDAELADQPDSQALLHSIIGRAYERLGLLAQAEQHAEEALRLSKQVFGDESREYAIALQNLASARLQRSDVASAREFYEEALSISRRLNTGDHADVADAMCRVGEIAVLNGQYEAAERVLSNAVAMHRRLSGSPTDALASALYSLVFLYVETGRISDAERAAREGLPIVAATVGEESTKYIEFMYTLGGIINEQGRYLEAAPLLNDAAKLANRILPPDRELRATITNAHAINLQMLGRIDEAEADFREAIALLRRILPTDALGLAPSLYNLAVLLCNKHELEEAEQLLREALRCYEANIETSPRGALIVMSRLSLVLEMRSDMAGAEQYAREALRLARAANPPIPSQIDDAAYRLGALLVELAWDDHAGPLRELAQARASESRALLEEVVAIRLGNGDATPVSIARAKSTLACACMAECVTSDIDDAGLRLDCYAQSEQCLLDAKRLMSDAATGIEITRSGNALQIAPMWLSRLYGAWHMLEPTAGRDVESARWYDQAVKIRRAAGLPPLPECPTPGE